MSEGFGLDIPTDNTLRGNDNSPSGSIFTTIPKIIAEVSTIGKTSLNKQQGYNYRSMDAVCQELHESVGKNKLTPTSRIISLQAFERQTKNGGTLNWVLILSLYRFTAEDGSFVQTEAIGEGMDSGDKACNKAMTSAYKNALLQTFLMMGNDDSEVDSPEPEPMGNQRQPYKQLPTCPKCGNKDIMRGKPEVGGLSCWKSKGGCEATFETPEHPFTASGKNLAAANDQLNQPKTNGKHPPGLKPASELADKPDDEEAGRKASTALLEALSTGDEQEVSKLLFQIQSSKKLSIKQKATFKKMGQEEYERLGWSNAQPA